MEGGPITGGRSVFRFGDQLMVKGYKWKEISDRSGLRTGSLRLRPSSQEQVDSWREHFGENLNFQYVFALDQRHFIPVLSYDQLSFDGQAAFLDYLHNQELQVRWLRGTFESSFRELQGITQNYQDIDLEKLAPILDSEKRRAGESLEFIGLKLPAFVLMTWGVIILIGIQVNFYLHLAAFQARVTPDDEVWNVPWIALYPGRGPKVFLGISIFLLPFAAVCGLAAQSYFATRESTFDLPPRTSPPSKLDSEPFEVHSKG